MGMKLLFIYNPHSGKGMIKNYLSDIMDIMIKAGYTVTVYATQYQGDAEDKARQEAGNYDRIICSGGDGTLDEVVTGIMSSGYEIPIGYIPAGSTNDFGNSLGIDKDMLKAARIAASGKPLAIDIGKFGETNFVYVAAFGIFTEVSYQTSQQLKNTIGHTAYLIEAIKQLRDIKSYRMQVEYDGNVLYDEFIYGMITNTKSVGGIKGIIPGDISLSDGKFEVTLIKAPKNPMELNEIVQTLAGPREESELVYSFQADHLTLKATENIPWTLDGEYGGAPSIVEITNLHHALEIIVE
ncbi:MAG: YegS/Rv2252/BmrU family lipid kinase [Lachnospiraceae bacterium]|nr:YegS/Rv2252/BmrU family lipid kinase [Lachnospiraceae bacterium]